MIDLKETLANIARAIVDNPDQVTVIAVEEDAGHIKLQLSVAPSDMGKVICKHGKISKAILHFIKAAANESKKKVTVDIE